MNIIRLIPIASLATLTVGVLIYVNGFKLNNRAIADDPAASNGRLDAQPASSPPVSLKPAAAKGATYVGRQQCAECHLENFEQHAMHGHASTFAEVIDTGLPAIFDGQTFDAGKDYGIYEYSKDDQGNLTASLPGVNQPPSFPIEYVLGSGHNAQTFLTLNRPPVGITEGIEHRVSCYPNARIGLTVGHGEKSPSRELEKFGDITQGEITQRCVYCHTTTGTINEGRIDNLVANVNCEKCHGPGSEHVRLARSSPKPPRYSVGADTWDVESEIQLCGDCHRLPRSITKQELRDYPDTITRFQPIGMLRSKCYLESSRQMTCSTCHNPHRSVHDVSKKEHEQNCINCHDETDAAHTLCPVSPKSNCIECHMPLVAQEQGIKFHDHWIRVRP